MSGRAPSPDGYGAFLECPGARQLTWLDRCQLWEAPVEDGGHVACGSEVATGGRCQQVAEWVLTSFGRDVEQVCPQGRPGGFSGESGHVFVDAVKFGQGLPSVASLMSAMTTGPGLGERVCGGKTHAGAATRHECYLSSEVVGRVHGP